MTEATFEERLEAFEARLTARLNDAEERSAKLERERDEYKKLALLLHEQVERLKLGLLGQKAERLPKNDAQLSLAILNLALGNDALATPPPEPEPEQTVPAHTRRKPVRKPLPDSLPRVAIEILPPEVQAEGLDAFELVGADTREVLERRPASCVVVAITYKKFVRKDRERGAATNVLAAPAVELPIERGLAGPSMLADTIVRRWQDHQPLTRLEDIYRREQLDLAKSTLCTWHEQLAALASPLVEAMFEDAYREPYLCVDATGVLVLAKDKCRNGHFWVLVAPESTRFMATRAGTMAWPSISCSRTTRVTSWPMRTPSTSTSIPMVTSSKSAVGHTAATSIKRSIQIPTELEWHSRTSLRCSY